MALSYGATEMEIEKSNRGSTTAGYVLNLYPKSPTGTTAATNKMTVAGAEHTRTYVLDHCTARMPAEHLINGRVAPLEIQCHHTMEHTAGKKARKGIVSTLYMASATATSGFVEAFANKQGATAGATGKKTVKASWSPTGSAGLTRYHSYPGSQTTGDCVEDVDWFVMYDPTGVSQAQLDLLKKSMTWKAARAAQDLYGREPEGCPTHHAGSAGAAAISIFTLAASVFVAFA